MLVLLYFLFILFFQCSAYTIIPLSNLQNTTIPFNKEKYNDYIISFFCIDPTESLRGTLLISMHPGLYSYIPIYIYDNKDRVIQDKENNNYFRNYYLRYNFQGTSGKIPLSLGNEYKTNTFYIIIENHWNHVDNITVGVAFYNTISNLTQDEINYEPNFQGFSFLFYVPYKHRKNINFGFKDLNEEDLGQIQIFEEYTYKVNYETKIGKYLENYVELKNDVSYYVNLTFTQYPTSKKIIFYFAQTDYSNLIFHSKIDMLEFDKFPVLRITNILLNMTTRKEGFKMLIE